MPQTKKKQKNAPASKPAKRRKKHWAVRFTGFKLYDEDADMANFVAENASITNLCAAAIRIQYRFLRKFFGETLPDQLDSYPQQNSMNERNEMLIDVDPDAHEQFIRANKEIEKLLGHGPGAAFLIGMAIERVNPQEVVADYLDGISQHFASNGRGKHLAAR